MSKRVLIVDDEPFVRKLIRDTLQTRGFQTAMAENGCEAVDVLGDRGADLVISDVVMPEMEGFELLKRIKQDHPGTKVIILTGFSRQHDISEFILYGADEYLTKPFQVHELLTAVDRVLAEHATG